MSTADHSKFLQLANRLITKHGRQIKFQKFTDVPMDPDRPWLGAGEPIVELEYTADAVFLPSQGLDLGIKFVTDEMLSRVDEVILAAANQSLESYNVIVDNSVRLAITWLQLLKPGDLSILYAIGVKR